MLLQDDEIEVETVGGLFRGFVHNVDQDLLVMKKAVNKGTGVCFPGLKYFYKDDIISSKLIKPSDVKEKQDSFRARSEMVKKTLEEIKAREAILFPEIQKPKATPPIQEKTEDVIKLPIDKSYYRFDYIIIDKVDRFFHDSISDIKTNRVVGLAFVGSDLDRGGDFSWIAVHVKNIYLYDISSLERAAFIEGLTEVFEDANIVKVVFDCRLASRVLLNKHNTLLTNVLDLQVLDVFSESFNQTLGKMTKKLSSLLESLTRNIDIPVGEITSQMRRMDEMKKSQFWKAKPTNNNEQFEEMIQAIIFEVGRLKDLRKSLMERLMKVVVDGVDIFLSIYRDSNDLRNLLSNNSVPLEFQDRLLLRNCAEESRKKTERIIEGRKLKQEKEKVKLEIEEVQKNYVNSNNSKKSNEVKVEIEEVQKNYVNSNNYKKSNDSESKMKKLNVVGSPLELDWIKKKTQGAKANINPGISPWSRLVKKDDVETEENISMVPDGCEMGSICYQSKKYYNTNNNYNSYKKSNSVQHNMMHNGNDRDCRSDVGSRDGSNGYNGDCRSYDGSRNGSNGHSRDCQSDVGSRDGSNEDVDSQYELDSRNDLKENNIIDSQDDVNFGSFLNSKSQAGMKNGFVSRNSVPSGIFLRNVSSHPRENGSVTDSTNVRESGKLEMTLLHAALCSALHSK